MEDTKTKKEKGLKKGSEINFGRIGLVAAIAGIRVYSRYKKFKQFINNVKFSIKVAHLENNKAIIHIMPINSLNVPFKIKRIEIINNDTHIASLISSCDVNLRMVANSNIEIPFNVLANGISKTTLESSQLAITYSFIGSERERLYTPIAITSNNPTKSKVTDTVATAGKAPERSSCGCR